MIFKLLDQKIKAFFKDISEYMSLEDYELLKLDDVVLKDGELQKAIKTHRFEPLTNFGGPKPATEILSSVPAEKKAKIKKEIADVRRELDEVEGAL